MNYTNAFPERWQAGDTVTLDNGKSHAVTLPAGRYRFTLRGAGGQYGLGTTDYESQVYYHGGDGGKGALASGEISFAARASLTLRPGPINTVYYYGDWNTTIPTLGGASYVVQNGLVILAAGCGGRGGNGAGKSLYINGETGLHADGYVQTACELSSYRQFHNINTAENPVNTRYEGGEGGVAGKTLGQDDVSAEAGSIVLEVIEVRQGLPVYIKKQGLWQQAQALIKHNGVWKEGGFFAP